MIIRLDPAHPVVIDADGERRIVETPMTIPANILAEAGVPLYPGDQILVDGALVSDASAALPSVPERLRLLRAEAIRVLADGEQREMRTAAATLGEALWEAGLALSEADEVDPGAQTPPWQAGRAEVRPARLIVIHADGAEMQAWTSASTVGEALSEARLTPMGLDYAIPDVDEPLPDDGTIRLVRVREEIVIEQEPLDFGTVYEPIADLEIDHQRVLEPGTYGVVVNRVRVRTEDGEETGRTVEGEFVAVEPKDRVIGYGTQIVIRTLVTDDGTIEYWRAVEMYATSYSPSRAGTPPDAPWYGRTASGQTLRKGLVAIDINYIPFGTRMYVVGYGPAEAADVGGGVRGRWIDLGYEDHNFVNWHQYVTVYFLTPVPAASSIVWIFP
jgi:uncharacterized protein YabE (DUF348 family)